MVIRKRQSIVEADRHCADRQVLHLIGRDMTFVVDGYPTSNGQCQTFSFGRIVLLLINLLLNRIILRVIVGKGFALPKNDWWLTDNLGCMHKAC